MMMIGGGGGGVEVMWQMDERTDVERPGGGVDGQTVGGFGVGVLSRAFPFHFCGGHSSAMW